MGSDLTLIINFSIGDNLYRGLFNFSPSLRSSFILELASRSEIDIFLRVVVLGVDILLDVPDAPEVSVADVLVVVVDEPLELVSMFRLLHEELGLVSSHEGEFLVTGVVRHLLLRFVVDDHEDLGDAHLAELHALLDELLLEAAVGGQSLVLVLDRLGFIPCFVWHCDSIIK